MAQPRRSRRAPGRSSAVVVALAMTLVSCSGDADRRRGVEDPLAEHLERALEIANEEWEASWVVHLAGARYEAIGDDFALEDIAYVFVSEQSSYYLVRFHADGRVSSGPVAGTARPVVEGFEFEDNEVTSEDALDTAWEDFGQGLVERCGPLRWLDVTGMIGSEGRQVWSVEYSIGGTDHTVWLEAVAGSVNEIDDEAC